MKDYLKRFKNVGTIISCVGLIGLLLTQFGVTIDLEWLDNTTKIVCTLLIVLGICNNPDSIGLDLPTKNLNGVDKNANK